MRLYECVIIARQDVSAGQVEELVNEFCAVIEKDGGMTKKREYWGLRSLAYRIKKNRKGHYVLLNIETEPATLAEFERIMGLNEDILRFMTISIESVDEGPSVMMQVKPERSERPRSDSPRPDRGERRESAQNTETANVSVAEGA